uniref:Uncharacterized protein LOC104238290 n=1 Tax=Nicotiana sylvestris TaxID=4096 RepID=A0A1U7XVE0_NICSY|nr:PREDICTED: uncharacterized protein LOC104238290 [Nicotiana sylvestris]
MDPVDISSHNALNTDAGTNPIRNVHKEAQAGGQETRGMDEGGVSLQSQNRTTNTAEPVNTRRAEPTLERPDENGSGTDTAILKMLEELAKGLIPKKRRLKKMTKRLDSKKFVQKPFPQSVAPKPIPKKFRMPDIPKYNGTTNPNKNITTYTCGIKGNDLEGGEIESVLLKRFRDMLSKGAMIWYHNLPPNYIDLFAMLVDLFVKAHAGSIKVATRKSDVFKIKQRENEMLREFVSRFQLERMELPPVSDD